MKKPNKCLLNQGVVAIGPIPVGQVRLITWRGMQHLESIAGNVRVMYKKHFRKPTTTRPLWSYETVQQIVDNMRKQELKKKT